MWRLQVTSTFRRKTRYLPYDEVPRGEPGTRDGREETVTGTGTGAGTESVDENGEGGGGGGGAESPVTYEVMVEVGRKTRERGRRQRLTRSHTRKTRSPSEAVASCGGPEPGNGRREIGPGRAEERRRSARNSRRVIDTRCGKWGRLGRKEKKRRQESVGSIDVDRGYLENRKEAERKAQGARG